MNIPRTIGRTVRSFAGVSSAAAPLAASLSDPVRALAVLPGGDLVAGGAIPSPPSPSRPSAPPAGTARSDPPFTNDAEPEEARRRRLGSEPDGPSLRSKTHSDPA